MAARSEFLAFLGIESEARDEAPAAKPVDDPRETVFRLAGQKGYPGLYYHDRYVGAGERLWRRFCDTAHPKWLGLAEKALKDYLARSERERSNR